MDNLAYTKFVREEDKYTIHMFTSGSRTFLTNSYLIETDNSVVAIDSMMINSDAKKVRNFIDLTGKPLVAIFITHGHPDHYNGVGVLVNGFGDIPVISTKGVYSSICKTDDIKEKKWKAYFGDEWPSSRVLPNKILLDGSSIKFDNLQYDICDLGAAESDSDLCIFVGSKYPVVFVGDVVFNGVHGFMNDGHIRRWERVLKKLSDELVGIDLLFTGHGKPDNPLKLIERQLLYLSTYIDLMVKISQGSTTLSSNQKLQFESELCSAFPAYKLRVFVQVGVDAVVKRIGSENSKNYELC